MDKTVRQINNSAFGPSNNGMREILAYVPVEPDGSVHVQLPANVPFTIDILDKNARRISTPHQSWMQLMPGETKTCTGCHTEGNTATPSHGRAGVVATAYAGATTAGVPFPNTLAALSVANVGDTMADTLAFITAGACKNGTSTTTAICSETPSIDVIYTDMWTDPVAAGRPADASFSYLYAALSTPQPTNPHCVTWDPLCRSTIHYPTTATATYHIQPLWDFKRTSTVAGDPNPDHTCTTCHNPGQYRGYDTSTVGSARFDGRRFDRRYHRHYVIRRTHVCTQRTDA